MSRVIAILTCGFALSGCASSLSPSFDFLSSNSGPVTTNIDVDSQPQGAEARSSSGAACQTPCSLSVPAAESTITFTHAGFQPQTVSVRPAPTEGTTDAGFGSPPPPRLTPNPVYAELAPAPAPAKKRPAPKRRPPAAAQTSSSSPAPAVAPAAPAAVAPAANPGAAWPPPR
jgi:hypothetical protein